jgi:dipeptidyl aminopeptidase/acylaminoacyl peptidase
MFKAAVPDAGMTDLLSDYGGMSDVYPRWISIESTQPYLKGPWWDNWQAYIDNSPLYHARSIRTPLLMIHGNIDGAVSFTQAVEMFNALRRMGNESVVMLEYVGENHVFSPIAQHDADQRRFEFFDHFLKGQPAPSWWADGKSSEAWQSPVVEPEH